MPFLHGVFSHLQPTPVVRPKKRDLQPWGCGNARSCAPVATGAVEPIPVALPRLTFHQRIKRFIVIYPTPTTVSDAHKIIFNPCINYLLAVGSLICGFAEVRTRKHKATPTITLASDIHVKLALHSEKQCALHTRAHFDICPRHILRLQLQHTDGAIALPLASGCDTPWTQWRSADNRQTTDRDSPKHKPQIVLLMHDAIRIPQQSNDTKRCPRATEPSPISAEAANIALVPNETLSTTQLSRTKNAQL